REIEGGAEVIEGKLPALLTAELELSTIRYASLPELVRSLRQTVRVWGAKELGGLPERLGLKGSPTSVKEIFAPPVREGGLVFGSGQNSERVVEDFLDTFFEKEKRLLDGLLTKDSHAQEH
ncbi:MAG: electron transfer flavoprotein subunit beta, partial [Dehalococcoidia bacterium]|nr:electron transfer flavoprotein subunit beta [Dehalococcoidia bacterium]